MSAAMVIDFNDAKPNGFYSGRQLSDPDYVTRLKERMEPHARSILARLWPEGRIERNEFVVGSIHGEKGQSFKISLEPGKVGVGMDFADGEACGDLIDCWALGTRNRRRARGREFHAICEEIEDFLGHPFKPRPAKAAKPEGPKEQLGAPTAEYHYTDADGAQLAVVYRYDQPGGKKTFRPWNVATRKHEAPEKDRPLYNQPGIRNEPWVAFVEGEKAADALIRCGIPATCAMGGSKAPTEKTDWSPLAGKHVLIWPDADAPGAALAENVSQALLPIAASVRILEPPAGKSEGWDAADAVDEGMDVHGFLNLSDRPAVRGFLTRNWRLSDYTVDPPPERRWLVKGVLPLGCAGVLAAMGDAGKGLLTLDLALKVACKPKHEAGLLDDGIIALSGTVAEHGTAVIYTAEDNEEEVRRRVAALDPQGARHDAELYVIALPDAGGPKPIVTTGRSGPETTPHFDAIRKDLLSHTNLKLVVFDPLSSFVLGDLNANQPVCTFATGLLSALATETGATVLACHHMTKKGEIRTPEQAREAIRGQAAIIDGVRFAYALWPAETKEARHICAKLSTEWRRNRVFKGAVAKSNAPADREVHTFVRDLKTGLLKSRTADLLARSLFSSDLTRLFVDAIREAAEDGLPYSRTGKSGLYDQRERLPEELQELSRNRLIGLADEALENRLIVQARDGSSRAAQWLDVPDGPFARGEGEWAEGAAPKRGRPPLRA